ncbi:DUF998 domain-containing protein [Shewanella avicenniae]|uniref:DUF998 domain-containing protein n=1 Tax=Shewanella avicenniae TaxID=2814294 RepID=A0ABX7QTE0_9GAMM|nr:DUF998 domain-containing protein [Shewanella avicenniae]QSX34743.1 DUF998 domain-containing protein [Shewanella avicenniae]
MEKQLRFVRLAVIFGGLGILGISIGVLVALVGASSVLAEHITPFNFTLSELGNYGHSPFAVVLNGGLFFGGLSLVLFCLYSMPFSKSISGALCYLAMALACFTLAGIGLFPINVYHLHTAMLKWFFMFGSMSALCYLINLALGYQSIFRTWSWLPAGFALLGQASFLVLPLFKMGLTEGNRPFYQEMVLEGSRPEFWWPACIEWFSFAVFLVWIISLIIDKFLYLKR